MTNEFKILMNELTIFEKILLIFGLILFLILFLIICIGIFIHSNPCQDLNNLICIYGTVAVPNTNP
ncbi:MAG: hypothetical protein QXS37_01540 [Candidatus Aenigmatarchaeota archaeon]